MSGTKYAPRFAQTGSNIAGAHDKLVRAPSVVSEDMSTSPRRKSLLHRLPAVRRSNSVAPEPVTELRFGLSSNAETGLFLADLAEEQAVEQQPFAERPFDVHDIAGMPSAETPLAVQPDAKLLLVEQPLAGHPLAGQPCAELTLVVQPDSEQHVTVQIVAQQASADEHRQRSAQQPLFQQLFRQQLAQWPTEHKSDQVGPVEQVVTEQQIAKQTGTQRRDLEDAFAEQSSAGQKSVRQQVSEQPFTGHYVTQHQSADQISAEQTSTEQPMSEQFFAEQPMADGQLPAERLTVSQPSVELHSVVQSPVEQPFAEHPWHELPSDGQPLHQRPLDEQPLHQQSSDEQPIVEQASDEQPSAEQLGVKRPSFELPSPEQALTKQPYVKQFSAESFASHQHLSKQPADDGALAEQRNVMQNLTKPAQHEHSAVGQPSLIVRSAEIVPFAQQVANTDEQHLPEQLLSEQTVTKQLSGQPIVSRQLSATTSAAEHLLSEASQPFELPALAEQQGMQHLMTTQPVMEPHAHEQLVTKQGLPYTEQPSNKQPLPSQDQPLQPLDQQLNTQQPSTEQPITKQPLLLLEQPSIAAEQLSVEQPCSEQPHVGRKHACISRSPSAAAMFDHQDTSTINVPAQSAVVQPSPVLELEDTAASVDVTGTLVHSDRKCILLLLQTLHYHCLTIGKLPDDQSFPGTKYDVDVTSNFHLPMCDRLAINDIWDPNKLSQQQCCLLLQTVLPHDVIITL